VFEIGYTTGMITSESVKTILCYGDSNTWGYVPTTDTRYPRDVRWPGALQNLLGQGFDVISEGLCGRTLVAEDPKKPHRTGITHLKAILESADPVDLIIVMLGTNDIKSTYNLSAQQIAAHLEQTIELIRDPKNEVEKVPEILIICPSPVLIPANGNLDPRMQRGVEISRELPALYKNVAEKYACQFMNAGDFVSFGLIDGYHFDAESHLKLATAIRDQIL